MSTDGCNCLHHRRVAELEAEKFKLAEQYAVHVFEKNTEIDRLTRERDAALTSAVEKAYGDFIKASDEIPIDE